MSISEPFFCLKHFRFRLTLIVCRLGSDLLFLLLTKLWPYRKRVVLDNLSACFPDYLEEKIKCIATAYFRHLADLVFEPFLLKSLKEQELRRLVDFENISLVKRLLDEGKTIVLMASHCGNWEYLLSLPVFTFCEVQAAYSPVNNKFLNNFLRKIRSKFGVELVPKADWYRAALKRKGKSPAILITIADQRPKFTTKHHLHFMNRKTFIQAGAARIASNLGCAVVYLDVFKKDRNCYKFSFQLITEEALRQNEAGIMESYFEALEKTIRRQPELWLWSHKRWEFRSHPNLVSGQSSEVFV
jgi:KDO2-lipid IV(A) lauroyltransferase